MYLVDADGPALERFEEALRDWLAHDGRCVHMSLRRRAGLPVPNRIVYGDGSEVFALDEGEGDMKLRLEAIDPAHRVLVIDLEY